MHHRSLLLSLLLSAIVVAAACTSSSQRDASRVSAASQDSAVTATPPDSEYTVLQDRPDRVVATLPNRMIVIAQRVPTEPVVSVQTWVKTGSIYEQEHVGAGLSHFLEHLLSGGTTATRTEAQNNVLLGEMGAQINAATSLDNVHYYINTTADHAATAVNLMSDWMQNNLITEEEFQREREVIQREFSMGEGDPGRIFWKLTQQARYTTHPARHPTIGYLDEFLAITREEIQDFYKRMYAPNNLIFTVVGDIDPRKVVDQVAALWADVPARELPELSFPVEPEIDSPREQSGYADIDRPRLRLAWPGARLTAEGDYELDLLASILGSGETSRLARNVRDEQRLVNDIQAYNYSAHWGEGFFGIDAELAAPEIEPVRQAVLAEVERLRNEPVSEDELQRAKRKVMAAVALRNQTVQGIASRLASDVIATGDPDYLAKYAEKIQSITPEELQRAAQDFLTPDRLITVTLAPQPEGHENVRLTRPAEPDGEFERVAVELDNRRLIDDLEASIAGSGAESAVVTVDPIEQFTLDNGLRVIVQRTTLVPGVAMQMYWYGGLLGEEPGREGYATAAANMLTRGTDQHTAQELAAAVEDLGANLSAETGNNTTFVAATALSEDWKEVMGLMAEVVLEPSFPEDEWKRMQPRLLAAIARQGDSWSGELRQHFRAAYYGEHPWSQSPLGREDVVAAITPDDLAAYHRSRLGAENAVLVVVGDVTADAVRSRAEELFGRLPAEPAHAFDAPRPTPPEPRIVPVPTRKPVAAVNIGFGPGIERADEDYAEVQVLSRLMSDFPTGWLEQQLRGRGPGLVYAVGAGMQTGLVPGHFAVLFNSSSDKVVEAIARTMSVVERAKSGDISDADLARAKAKVLTSEFFSRQGNSSRAAGLALDELYGVDDPDASKFLAEVKAMTAEDVRRAARAYLTNPVVVVMSNEPVDQAALEAAVSGEAPTTASTQPLVK